MNLITYTISKSIFEAIGNNQWKRKEIVFFFDKFTRKECNRLVIDKYRGRGSKLLEQFSLKQFPNTERDIKDRMKMIGEDLKRSCEGSGKYNVTIKNMETVMDTNTYGFRDICACADQHILIVKDRNEWNGKYNIDGGNQCNYRLPSLRLVVLELKEPNEINKEKWWKKILIPIIYIDDSINQNGENNSAKKG